MKRIFGRVDKIICLEEFFYDLPAVIFDRARAARMGVGHLISLGHKRIAATDESVIAAMAAIKDVGLDIPGDIAITSIDNIEMASMIRPALTTVRVPK